MSEKFEFEALAVVKHDFGIRGAVELVNYAVMTRCSICLNRCSG